MLDCTVLKDIGIVGPFLLEQCSQLNAITQFVRSEKHLKDRHIDSDVIKDFLLNDVGLRREISRVFGLNLDIWRTNFFLKTNGSTEVGWHHDRHFENGSEPLALDNLDNHFSVLIAVTDLLSNDGVIEFIPGSHRNLPSMQRDLRPFHMRSLKEHFLSIPAELLALRQAIPLQSGQFALFHSALLHRSLPFVEGDYRISMVVRLCRRGTVIPTELLTPNALLAFN